VLVITIEMMGFGERRGSVPVWSSYAGEYVCSNEYYVDVDVGGHGMKYGEYLKYVEDNADKVEAEYEKLVGRFTSVLGSVEPTATEWELGSAIPITDGIAVSLNVNAYVPSIEGWRKRVCDVWPPVIVFESLPNITIYASLERAGAARELLRKILDAVSAAGLRYSLSSSVRPDVECWCGGE
jgi:hypothetical protein